MKKKNRERYESIDMRAREYDLAWADQSMFP